METLANRLRRALNKSKLAGYLRLMRIPNDVTIGIAVIVGEYIGLASLPAPWYMINGFFSGFLTSASVMVINDVCDVDVDRVNAPHRPIPSGLITINEAKLFSLTLVALGLFTAFSLTIWNVLIVILFWSLGIVYDWKLKRTGLIGNSIVSLSVAIPFLYGSLAVQEINNLLILLFSTMAFLTNMGREIIKGIMDYEGDKKAGIKTAAVLYGPKQSYMLSASLIIIAIFLSVIPPLINLVNFYYILLVSITDFLLLYSIYVGYKLNNNKLNEAKTIILGGMIVGLFAYMIGCTGL